ncbi:MAG: nucleotidyltransferase family protein [Candidatus Bathyarchaeia archaeon]
MRSSYDIKTAIILAGGEGLRLRPLTSDTPKAMISVAGKPLLQWIIEWLTRNGIQDLIIGVAYQKEKIMEYFDNGNRFNVGIRYSVHTVEGGTSQGFRQAIQRYVDDDYFLAMNGDELVDLSLASFAAFHRSNGGTVTIAVGPLRSPYGVVELQGANVVGFVEKPILHSHHVSVGTYIFSHDILGYLPEKGDVERTTFPHLASLGKLKAYVHTGFWATVNTMKDLEDLENQLKPRSV